MGFTKLDEGILQSSVMAESSDTFKVWVALLAACKQDGVARVSPIFISSICRLDQSVVDEAIATLESPDTRSRSTEDDGRRIRRVDGGFFVINYQKYRDFTLSDSPEAVRQRRHRERERTRDNALHVTTSRDISASASSSASSSEDLRGGVGEGDLSEWRAAVELEIRKGKEEEGLEGFELESAVKERMGAWDEEHLKPGRFKK